MDGQGMHASIGTTPATTIVEAGTPSLLYPHGTCHPTLSKRGMTKVTRWFQWPVYSPVLSIFLVPNIAWVCFFGRTHRAAALSTATNARR